MEGLTFGEQVKIMLKRKGMTIKQLAERIEERTGKAMSRQNLTQRLGRDNFQEKDMRMIAEILGCPFQLNIFPEGGVTEEMSAERDVNRRKRKTKPVQSMEENQIQQTEERDITIGELYGIHEELDELEKSVAGAEQMTEEPTEEEYVQEELMLEEPEQEESVQEEPVMEEVEEETAAEEEAQEEVSEETAEDISPESDNETEEEDIRLADEETETEEVRVEKPEYRVEPKKEKRRSGGIFLRRKGEDIREIPEPEDAKPVKNPTQRIIKPDSEDFQPVIQHEDVKEDLSVGEVNPYTGREYQTNSVRMHPTRIGYVQVYDRKEHKWTDMTEWAFLGYQERKKALLGKDYEPPIYLD